MTSSFPLGLNYTEKKSIFLILIGTFLEYFDFILYMHLAVVMNPLFFPKGDQHPWLAGLLGVFAFSSAYLLRPLGSFVFGYIGDKIGRKASIVWTSGMMGLAALTIACLPTYESIGFSASLCLILARALQGFSSIGEVIGAQVFVAEVAERSRSPHLTSMLSTVAIGMGSLVALLVGQISLYADPVNGWRWPFLFGATVALVGGIIRLKAIESPAFLEARQKKMTPSDQEVTQFFRMLEIRKKNYWYYFGIEMIGPMTLYFTFRYCVELLTQMNVSVSHAMGNSTIVMLVKLAFLFFLGWLTFYYKPLTILKNRLLIGLCLTPILIWIAMRYPTIESILMMQLLLGCLFSGGVSPAQYTITQAFPVIGRCTNLGSAFAISHAMIYFISTTCVYSLDQWFGLWGVGALFMVNALISLVCAQRFTAEVQEETTFASSSLISA